MMMIQSILSIDPVVVLAVARADAAARCECPRVRGRGVAGRALAGRADGAAAGAASRRRGSMIQRLFISKIQIFSVFGTLDVYSR